MTFTQPIFLFAFLPVVIIFSSIFKNMIFKNLVLVAFSLLFYAWADPKALFLLVLVTIWIYLTGLQMDKENSQTRKKWYFGLSCAFLVLILFLYKYLGFILSLFHNQGLLLSLQIESSLPLGISFYIFSALSYLADVYMQKAPVQKNFLNLSVYIAYFGKVSMGPIVQYHDMLPAIEKRESKRSSSGEGVMQFLKGLAMKVILADQLSLLYASMTGDTSVLGAWLASIAYSLQLYFDFAGYSNMAIGLSRFFGFDFAANFDYPYTANSVQDFWRRWHISLSRWFRDYIYIPLGGNRVSTIKYIRNILIVWTLTGIWHGANWTFIVWGLYYALWLLAERFFLRKYTENLPRSVRIFYTLIIVNVGWVFFSASSLSAAIAALGHMIGIGSSALASSSALFYLKTYLPLLLLSAIACTHLFHDIKRWMLVRLKNLSVPLLAGIYLILFFLCLALITSSTSQTFLYFAF
jgi:alginate O-acetyltransferase complex protein AlgI